MSDTSSTMKALYYPAWGKLEMRQLGMPSPGPDDALVRVLSCGICGSELETFKSESGRRTPPLVMGHEFCGVVESVSGDAPPVQPGQRVICHAVVHCGACSFCLRGATNLCLRRQVFGMHRPGAFAEFVAVPKRVLIPWPAGLAQDAAVFAEPLANGINAMRQGSNPDRSRVVVIGAGPIGLMCLFAATRLYQSSVIVSDLLPDRLRAAVILGAACTVNPQTQDLQTACRELWNGERAVYVIDAVGSAMTKRIAMDLVEPGGTVVWVGLHEDAVSLKSYNVTLGQRCIAGSYSGSLDDMRLAVEILSEGSLDTSWVTHCPIERAEQAFRELLRPNARMVKVVLDF